MEKQVLDTFSKGVQEDFCRFIKNNDLKPTPGNMLDFLIQYNYLRDPEIKRKAVLSAFHDFDCNDCKRRSIIFELEFQLGIPERTLWHIMQKHTEDFSRREDLELI